MNAEARSGCQELDRDLEKVVRLASGKFLLFSGERWERTSTVVYPERHKATNPRGKEGSI